MTGGAIRLGASISEALAREGWDVVVHANQSRTEGEALCVTLRTYGVRAWCVAADLSCPEVASGFFEEVCTRAGALDALVNNASLFTLDKTLSAHESERLFRVNVEQPVTLLRLLHDHLKAREARGAAVNLLDQRIARVSKAAATPYELSKLLLAEATLKEAKACAPLLRVNAVAPGAILLPSETSNKEPAGHFPLGRRPAPSDVADAVRWLLDAESVTGQTLYVDGGQHLL